MGKDPTREAAGIPATITSNKDLLIPPAKLLLAKIESRELKLNYLKDLANPDSGSYYVKRRVSLVHTLEAVQEQLEALSKDWESLPEEKKRLEKQVKRLRALYKRTEMRTTIETFLRLKLKMDKLEQKGCTDASPS